MTCDNMIFGAFFSPPRKNASGKRDWSRNLLFSFSYPLFLPPVLQSIHIYLTLMPDSMSAKSTPHNAHGKSTSVCGVPFEMCSEVPVDWEIQIVSYKIFNARFIIISIIFKSCSCNHSTGTHIHPEAGKVTKNSLKLSLV